MAAHSSPMTTRLVDTMLLVGKARVPLNLKGKRPEALSYKGRVFVLLFTTGGVAYYREHQ